MLKMSSSKDSLELMPESDLKQNEIMERYNLQKAIVKSWDAFTSEIGMSELYLIGQEIKPHESVRDSIDILAFDANENVPVVIELKRSKDKFQLLQAITYASMVAAWGRERFLAEARKQNIGNIDDLSDLIQEAEISKMVKIVLIAEKFDPEVIIASDWLFEQYKLDVTAFGIDVFKRNEDIYLSLNQKYPLLELHESYETRIQHRNTEDSKNELTWDEVASTLKYSWGRSAIQILQKVRAGAPGRRRFSSVRTNYDGFDWITVNMRREYLNVYLRGLPENGEIHLKSKFKDAISVSRWRDGYSFHLRSQSQFEDLLRWLEIDSETSRKKKVA
jgi:hypothetical protein